MNPTYDFYDKGDPWPVSAIDQNPFYLREIKMIKSEVSKRIWGTALDLGAGYGRASLLLSHFAKRFILLDGSKKMLHKAKELRPGSFCIAASIDEGWPFDPNVFDLIVGMQIANHARDLKDFFSKISKHLKKDGMAILSVGNINSVISWLEGLRTLGDHGFRRFSMNEVKAAAKRSELSCKVLGGSGLFSPYQKLKAFEKLNRWNFTAEYSHLVVVKLTK